LKRRNTIVPLVPPKPKLLETATSMGINGTLVFRRFNG